MLFFGQWSQKKDSNCVWIRVLLNLSRFQFLSKATMEKLLSFHIFNINFTFSSFSLFLFSLFPFFLFFICSFLPSFYFYFWPMYSLNMFMTHSKRILRLQLRFVSGYEFRYISHTRVFEKVANVRFLYSFLRFNMFWITQTSSGFRNVLNERIKEWTFLFFIKPCILSLHKKEHEQDK